MTSIMGHVGILLLGQYDSDAIALFDRFDAPPSPTIKGKINTAIVGLKDAGIWAIGDSLHVPAKAGEQTGGLCDWMRSTKSAILAGSAAWNDTTGFVGSTSGTSYINLDFIPSTDGVNFTLDDACVCAYITTAATGDGDYIGGNGVSGSVTRINRTAGGVAHYGTVNAAVSSSAVNSSSLSLAGKLVCANRAGSGTNTTTTLYVDAVSQGTDTADASSLSAATIYACARNSNGSLTGAMNGTLGAVFFGAALTVQQQLDFNTIIEAYLA